ncbi:MAG: hypothetical protein ACI92O_000314 [Colwellia sp.]|jgi:hypothetical protein
MKLPSLSKTSLIGMPLLCVVMMLNATAQKKGAFHL